MKINFHKMPKFVQPRSSLDKGANGNDDDTDNIDTRKWFEKWWIWAIIIVSIVIIVIAAYFIYRSYKKRRQRKIEESLRTNELRASLLPAYRLSVETETKRLPEAPPMLGELKAAEDARLSTPDLMAQGESIAREQKMESKLQGKMEDSVKSIFEGVSPESIVSPLAGGVTSKKSLASTDRLLTIKIT